MTSEETRAVLMAYVQVMEASWPDLHSNMAQRAQHWPKLSAERLAAELAALLAETSVPSCPVRIFWKHGRDFKFAGCNSSFAQDAGFPSPEALLGVDDFDSRLPWVHQASKYRADDEQVFHSGKAKLDIVERQRHTDGRIFWVRAGKAPIIGSTGGAIGILGMYEMLDDATGRRLYAERLADEP
jgi:PAS domain-containing protein